MDTRAQSVRYHRYTTHDGLPSGEITTLAQTKNGLLWVGTDHGLVVYDGHEFRPIPMPDSVRKISVHALEPMPDGSVWAGVGHDAVKVAPHGAVQSHLLDSHHVVDVLRRDGRIRFVTHRAVWTLGEHQAPVRTPFRYETLTNVTLIRGADLGPGGRLWILNSRRGPGRVRSDGTVGFPEGRVLPGGSMAGGDAAFSDLHGSVGGDLLVTEGTRLFRFDPVTDTFAIAATDLSHMSDIQREGDVAYLTDGPVVQRYNIHTRRTDEPLRLDGRDRVSTTTTALRDQEGGLWIGTEKGLLHVAAPRARHAGAIDGTELRYGLGFRMHENAIWANTWGEGLFQLRPWGRRVTPGGHTRWVLPRSHDAYLHALAGPGRHWYRWRAADGWERIGFADGAVRGHVDSSGIGYFWHNDGLYRHVPTGDTTAATRLRAWPVGDSQHHLMGPAPNGDIILFDEGDVLRLRRPDGTVTDTIASVPEHASSAGRRLTIDADGRIWCPFSSLLRIDPKEGTTQTLLKRADVENVQMAGDSLAMAKTNEGLYLINARTGDVRRHLTKADGLLSNDVNGSLLTPDSLFVGHPTGYTRLPTESLLEPPQSPHSVLTGMEVNLDERSPTADSLRAADERAIGFSYTGASLAYPDRVRYEVRLMPRDTTWSRTDRRFDRYTNLGPGTYRFEVRARLAGRTPGPAATYTFTIPPYFYETWWFQLLVGLGLIGLAAGAYRWRTVRLRRRQEQLKQAVEDQTRQLRARTEELAAEKEKTERQAEKLAELDEAKNRFFAHVSHEFRTPLSLILSPLRDALQRSKDEEISFGRNEGERMIKNAERLQRLIDQLLDLATLEAGRMELERQPGDLASVVERAAEAFRSRAEQKEIDLRVERPEDRIDTRFDPEKVETITSNLVGNAVKFTPAGGAVTVRVETVDHATAVEAPADGESVQGTARIVVADTGPGIEPAVQDTIFDRFEQADNSPTRDHEGTGLGLALTSELVELHGGAITVDSAPGEGATFVVRLPVVPVTGAPDEERRCGEREGVDARTHESVAGGLRNAETRGGEGRAKAEEEATVLVVEDNAEMRSYLREELSEQWAILAAADGEEGWRRVQEERPDLVVSDVMMPATDGFELCRRIKGDPDLRTIPVLLLTARADEEATLEGLESGADDYVAKPFGPKELRRRIANHLAARQHLADRYREEVEVQALEAVVETEDWPFVEEVLAAIDERLSNPDFGVGDLAGEMALSRRQLTRRLKDTSDTTPGALIKRRRIERAKALLREGAETVSEVAYATGFRSPSSFSQSFRKEVGQTPSAYLDAADEQKVE